MFRTANTLQNYNFLNLIGRSSQVFSKTTRWKSYESCNKNDPSVVGSSLRHENGQSKDFSAYRWTHHPDQWNQPYLMNRSRSASVESAVNAVLSSPNSDNDIEKLPPLRHMPCDDLIAMLIDFDDAGLPTHCRIMNTLVEEITDQTKISKYKNNR